MLCFRKVDSQLNDSLNNVLHLEFSLSFPRLGHSAGPKPDMVYPKPTLSYLVNTQQTDRRKRADVW